MGKCRLCGSKNVELLIDFGMQPIVHKLKKDKDFIDENDLISLVSEFPQSDIPSFYNELKIQIEKVNELHVDF